MIEPNTTAFKYVSLSLALGSFLTFCNLYVLQPLLPTFSQHFAVSSTTANWLFAATSLSLALSLLPWAIVSDKIGRRPVILFSLVAMSLVNIATLFVDSFVAMVILRSLMGIALGAFAAVAGAYMADELSPTALAVAIGTYISANSLGGIMGRLMGGSLGGQWGWHTPIAVLTILGLIVAIIVFSFLPKQRYRIASDESISQHTQNAFSHLTNPTLWLAMLIGAFCFAIFINIFSVMIFRLVAAPFNLPVITVSFIFTCYLSGTISARMSGHWLRRFSAPSGMALGAVIILVGCWVTLIEHIGAIILGLLIVSSGGFFIHSLAYGWVNRHAQYAKASANALYLIHYYIGGSLGGFLLLACWGSGGWIRVVEGASGIFVVLMVVIGLLHYRHQQAPLATLQSH